jgi:hypothetical protein
MVRWKEGWWRIMKLRWQGSGSGAGGTEQMSERAIFETKAPALPLHLPLHLQHSDHADHARPNVCYAAFFLPPTKSSCPYKIHSCERSILPGVPSGSAAAPFWSEERTYPYQPELQRMSVNKLPTWCTIRKQCPCKADRRRMEKKDFPRPRPSVLQSTSPSPT